MPTLPYRLRYQWDGKRAGYYAVIYVVSTGDILYTTRTYRTRKDAREEAEDQILTHQIIGGE